MAALTASEKSVSRIAVCMERKLFREMQASAFGTFTRNDTKIIRLFPIRYSGMGFYLRVLAAVTVGGAESLVRFECESGCFII